MVKLHERQLFSPWSGPSVSSTHFVRQSVTHCCVKLAVCQQRVPKQLLSDRGTNFLLGFIQGVCWCEDQNFRLSSTNQQICQEVYLQFGWHDCLVLSHSRSPSYLLFAHHSMVWECMHEFPSIFHSLWKSTKGELGISTMWAVSRNNVQLFHSACM